MSVPPAKKPTVVVQYPFIPLYRVPIFRRLAESLTYDFIFWAGKGSPDKFLKTLSDIPGVKFEEVPLSFLRVPVLRKTLELQLSALSKLLRTRPDLYVILANPNSISSWISMLWARVLGIPVIAWSHGFLNDEKGLKGLIRSLYYRIPHGHVVYGDKAKEIMAHKGFDASKIDVIYNSLDYETQAKLRDQLGVEDRMHTREALGVPGDAVLLIAIGRLMTKLKLDQAISAIKLLQEQGRNVYLLIVGDGPESENLRKLAESTGISDRVIFYGACHEEERLAKLFNAADITVVMGKVGLSAMHSLGYGIPLLTNDRLDEHFPEIEAVVEGRTGWYFSSDNIYDFISKIRPVEYRGLFYRSCIEVIESRYTPARQAGFIENAFSKYLLLKTE
jgi:glycosyltransferase involved in cell wall biosynthesis